MSQPISQSVNQPANQPISQPANQSANQSVSQTASRPSTPAQRPSRQEVPDGGLLVLGVPWVSGEAGGGRGITFARRRSAPQVVCPTEKVCAVPGPRVPDEARPKPGGGAHARLDCIVTPVVSPTTPIYFIHHGPISALSAAVIAVVVVKKCLALSGKPYHVSKLANGATVAGKM